MSLLKSISIRVDEHPLQLFYNFKYPHFPLVWRALRFYNYPDSMVQASVKNVVLTLYKKGLAYFAQFPFSHYYACLASLACENWKGVGLLVKANSLNDRVGQVMELVDQFYYFADLLAGCAREQLRRACREWLFKPHLQLLVKSDYNAKIASLLMFQQVLSHLSQASVRHQLYQALLGKLMPRSLQKSPKKLSSFSYKFKNSLFFDYFERQVMERFSDNYSSEFKCPVAVDRPKAKLPNGSVFGLNEKDYREEVEYLQLVMHNDSQLNQTRVKNPYSAWFREQLLFSSNVYTNRLATNILWLYLKSHKFTEQWLELASILIASLHKFKSCPFIATFSTCCDCLVLIHESHPLENHHLTEISEAVISYIKFIGEMLTLEEFDQSELSKISTLQRWAPDLSQLTLKNSGLVSKSDTPLECRFALGRREESQYWLKIIYLLKTLLHRLGVLELPFKLESEEDSNYQYCRVNEVYSLSLNFPHELRLVTSKGNCILVSFHCDSKFLFIFQGQAEYKTLLFKFLLDKLQVKRSSTLVVLSCGEEEARVSIPSAGQMADLIKFVETHLHKRTKACSAYFQERIQTLRVYLVKFVEERSCLDFQQQTLRISRKQDKQVVLTRLKQVEDLAQLLGTGEKQKQQRPLDQSQSQVFEERIIQQSLQNIEPTKQQSIEQTPIKSQQIDQPTKQQSVEPEQKPLTQYKELNTKQSREESYQQQQNIKLHQQQQSDKTVVKQAQEQQKQIRQAFQGEGNDREQNENCIEQRQKIESAQTKGDQQQCQISQQCSKQPAYGLPVLPAEQPKQQREDPHLAPCEQALPVS